jgi:hypothetical protein
MKSRSHYIAYIVISLLTIILLYSYFINLEKTTQEKTEYIQQVSLQISS